MAPVGLVSAISAFFVFIFGILLFPRLGREDLSARNVIQKAVGGVLIMAGVVLIETTGATH